MENLTEIQREIISNALCLRIRKLREIIDGMNVLEIDTESVGNELRATREVLDLINNK